jgi:tetratricopeptide (TPR) repeat protein
MRFYPLLWVLPFLLPISSAFAGTIISRDDARECYLATLAENSSLADKQGLAACARAANGENVSIYLRAAALANRADIRLRMHDYAGTIADADASIGLDPELAAAYLNRGAGLIGLQRYQDALAALDKAIALSLSDRLQLAYFNRGMARENLGDIRGAYFDYKRASDLDPKFEPAKEQLARFTVTLKQ